MDFLAVKQEQFQAEIKPAYEQRKSRFESLVTVKTVEAGESTTFNLEVSGGEAQQKSAFGEIPDIGGGTSTVKCSLATFYARTTLSKQQLDDTSVDGQMLAVSKVMAAAERKKDSLIRTALDAATNTLAHGNTGLTETKVKAIWNHFSDALVFENGETPVVKVGTLQWQDLMAIDAFKNADYIGSDNLPYLETKAREGRLFYDMIFICDPAIKSTSNVNNVYAFVKSAVGLAMKPELTEEDSQLYFDKNTDTYKAWTKIKAGAKIIDQTGVYKVACYEGTVSS